MRLDATDLRVLSGYASNNNRWYMAYDENDQELGMGFSWGGSFLVLQYWQSLLQNIDQWYHIAIVKESSVWKCYQDGVEIINHTQNVGASTNLWDYNSPLYVGVDFYNSSPFFQSKCYIDELRWSKGIARWTSDFTPETGPYTT